MTNKEKFEEIVSSSNDNKLILSRLKSAFPNMNIVTSDNHFSIELNTDFLTQEYHYEESSTKDSMASDTCI